jgi:aromatic ring hydroxylase
VLRDIELLDASYQRAIEQGSENEFGLWLPDSRSLEAAKLYFMQAYPMLMTELRRLIAPELFHLFEGEHLPERLAESLGKIWSLSPKQVVDRLDLTAQLFDLVLSSFGMRQEMYEMYKAGSPDRAARYFWNAFQHSEC